MRFVLKKFASFLILLSFGASAASGPVLSYPFNEGSGTTTADISGNNQTGTLVNGPTWGGGPSGGVGALTFNGTNTYVTNATINWTGGPVTVSFWNFVPVAPTTSGRWTFFLGSNSTNRMGAICPDSDSQIYWDYGNPAGNGRLTFNYAPYIGKWTHITLVSSGLGGTYKAIYLNGQLAVFAVAADSPQVTITGLQLGHSGLDAIGTNHFKGSISDFRIYNRVLSDAEIAAVAQLAPVASPETYSTSAGGTLSVPTPGVLANDTDYNGDARTAILDSTTTNGSLALNANGSFTYTANNGFSGSDSFRYHALDSAGNSSNSATVTIQVPGNASVTAISPTAGTAGTVLTNVTLTGTGFQKSAASRPGNTTSFNGHDYAFFNTAVSWASAKSSCAALGGHLATIANAAENQFVYNLGGLQPAWLGATDEVTEGTFLWVTNEPFSYQNWAAGQPDNSGGIENYLAYYTDGLGDWNDNAASHIYPYVCEFETSVTPRVFLIGASTIEGYNVRWNSANQLLFDINLTGAAGGKYYVQLINPDGLVTVSNQLFTISPTRWHLSIPIPYSVQVTNTQTYSTAIPIASSGDATATISFMEVDALDTSTNQRLYDFIALLHTAPTFDTTTFSGKMGAGQLARGTNYPNPTMNLFMRNDFESGIFGTDEMGVGMTPNVGRTTFNFDSTRTLWARFYSWRGDGNAGNLLSNIILLVNMDSVTMPGAYMTGNSQKTLQWTVSPAREAVAQKLYKASAPAGPYTLVTTFNDNITNTYQDLTMQNGATTYYKVVAQTADGTPGADSNVFTVALPNTLQVTAMSPLPNSVVAGAPTTVTATLSGAVNVAGVHANSVKLVRAGPDGLFDTADDVTITPVSLTVVGTNQIKLDLTGLNLPPDKYRLSLTNGTNFPSTGLYAYWPMNEGAGTSAGDTSGNNRNLTLANTAWTTGFKNGGLLFNGSNSVATLGLADLPVPWTLTFYVNRLDTANAWQDLMVTGSSGNRVRIEEYNGTKKVGFTHQNAANYTFNYSTPTGVWTQLTYVAVSGSTSLYANGVLQGTVGDAISLPLTSIGGSAGAAPYSLNGSLDEMRVYNRTLTAAELYATSNGVSDLSGNALDGEFSGTFPSGDGLIGGNFYAQFTVVPAPFQVTAMTPAPNSVQSSPVSSILLSLSDTVNASSLNKNSVQLKSAGPDGILDTADDVTITPTALSVVSGNQIKIDFVSQTTQTEKYRVTLYSIGNAPAPSTTYAANINPADIAVADMDGDGKPDIVVGDNWGAPNPTILLGDGTGKFGTGIGINNWNTAIYCVAVGDFNLDGKMDVVQGSNGVSSNCPILLNTTTQTGTVTFAPYANFPMGANDNCIRVADFNGDGKPDLVSSNQAAGTVGVRLNTTVPLSNTLSFGAHTPFTTGSTCRFVAVGDINGDGKPDIVSCNYGNNSVSVLLNITPTNGTTPMFAPAVNFTTDTQPNSVELGDINGDGKLDIIVPCFNSNQVDVFINTTPTNGSTATFLAKTSFAVTTNPSYVSVADIDGDGKPDIACANEATNDVALLINTTPALSTTPTFAPVAKYPVGTRPDAVKIADLSGTGLVGVIAANGNSSSITVLYPFLKSIQSVAGVNLDGEFSGTFPSGDSVAGGNFTTTFQVTLTPTTVAAAAPASVAYGAASVALSAVVSSSQPVNVGTVTFQLKNGAANVGTAVTSATVANGNASANYSIPVGTAAGTYTVVATYNGSGTFYGSSDSSQSLTITTVPLVVTPANASRAYGAANPTFTGTLATLVSGDTITATYATVANTTSPIGSYSITATLNDPGNRLSNYSVTLKTGTLTVNTAPLIVTPNNFNRNYGSANPVFSGNISGLVNGDNITATYACSATTGSPAGPYSITAMLNDPNRKLGNYAATLNTGTLTVNKVALSITANSTSRVYGAANPAFTGSITGVVNSDNITATYASSATPGSPATTYSIVPTPVDPGGALGNYNLTQTNGTLTVSKAPLSVTANSFSRAYGVANPTFTGTLAGVVNSDNITASYSCTATTGSPVGTYPIVPALADPGNKLGNYTVTTTNGILNVGTATALLVVTPDSFTRLYGDVNPALTGSIVGLVNGDNITATYSTSATVVSAPGNYIINATLSDPGNKLPNYTLNQNVGQLTINKASLSVTGGTFSRLYGAANPTLSGTISGIKNGDNITATYATSASAASAVGPYAVIPTFVDPGNKLANYNSTITNGTLNVTPAPLTVTPANANRVYAVANPTFTGSIVGVLNNDGIGATYSTTATLLTSIGTYSITAALTDPNSKAGNYAVTLNTGTLTITTAAAITVTAANASRTYGAANPAFTGNITGVLNADGISATYATSATPNSIIGTYAIVPALVDPNNRLGNYAPSIITNGTLTINPAALTVTPADVSRPYGTANPAFTGTLSGVQNADGITATYSTSATTASTIGTYTIASTLVDPNSKLGNYTVTQNTGTLTVGKATLNVIAATISRIYGDANPIFTGTITGVVNNDAITAAYDSAADASTSIGDYPIVPTLLDPGNKLGNYQATITNGTLTIFAASLSVTANDATRAFGSPDPQFTGILTGVVNNDNITAMYATGATSISAVGQYPIVPIIVDPANKVGNYNLASTNGTLTIIQAVPTLTWAPPARIFAGVPLSALQLNAQAFDPTSKATLNGTFTYAPIAGVVLAPGLSQALSVTFTPSDAVNYTTATLATTLNVDPALPVSITSALTDSAQKDAFFTYTITADGSAPMTFSTGDLPAGLILTGNNIAGTPTVTGVYFITLNAANYSSTDSKTLKLTITQAGTNHAPVFSSPPTASPNPATVGTPIQFTALATDADNDNLDYEWDFGDGTTGQGASVAKTFAVAGVYAVHVTVSDGQASAAQSVNVAVLDQPVAAVFTVSKVKLAFSFTKSGKDALSFGGAIPLPAAFTPAGKIVRVVIGGLDVSSTFTDKGKSADKAFTLKSKSGAASGTFSYESKNTDLFAKFAPLGFTQSASIPSVDFPIIVVLDGTSYLTHTTLNYMVKVKNGTPQSGMGTTK